jgi:flagellar export protein FliJ
MKRFRFNLQAVLSLRQREEKKALEVYARELLALQKARTSLGAVEAELECERALACDGELTARPVGDLARMQLSYAQLSVRRDGCARILNEAAGRVNIALALVLERRKQRRMVDTCHDKRRAEFDFELVKSEQREADELAGRARSGALSTSHLMHEIHS